MGASSVFLNLKVFNKEKKIYRLARNNEIERHRVRSCQAPQMPSMRGCEDGVGKALKRTYTQKHSAGPCRGRADRIPIHTCGEGGSGEKQGEKEWWEGHRRERENGEKQGGGERREDENVESCLKRSDEPLRFRSVF